MDPCWADVPAQLSAPCTSKSNTTCSEGASRVFPLKRRNKFLRFLLKRVCVQAASGKKWMCRKCDRLCFLLRWQSSSNARIESHFKCPRACPRSCSSKCQKRTCPSPKLMPEVLPGTPEMPPAHTKAARSTYMDFTLQRHCLPVEDTSELHAAQSDHFRAVTSMI